MHILYLLLNTVYIYYMYMVRDKDCKGFISVSWNSLKVLNISVCLIFKMADTYMI